MAICYNKLWKILIDKNMSKTQLIRDAKISTNAMAHLGKNEDVRVEVLVKICNTLNCTMDEIMEILPESESKHE
jgi:DNA (cytosine-5)-methyltransferase 1